VAAPRRSPVLCSRGPGDVWSERTLLDAALAHHGAREPAHLLRQVQMVGRRIDAVLALGNVRIGIEAKVSRADYQRETNEKRWPTWYACHECVYLAPPDVIDPDTLPRGWGLWEVLSPDRVVTRRPPIPHEPMPGHVGALATSLLRRAAAVESRERDPGDPVVLRAEVERLEGLLAHRDAAVARERARAQRAAEQVLATLGEQPCSMCGDAIRYTRYGRWEHVDRSREAPCEEARAAAERARRMAATGAEYGRVQAPPVLPEPLSTDC